MGAAPTVTALTRGYCLGDSITQEPGFLNARDTWYRESGFLPGFSGRYRATPAPKAYAMTGAGTGGARAYRTTGAGTGVPLRVSSAQTWPQWSASGAAGRKVGDVSAAPGVPAGTTLLVVVLQVNDDAAQTAAATFAAAVRQLRDQAFATTPTLQNIIWVTTLCDGEKWPTGQNALDLAADGVDSHAAQLVTIMAEDSRTSLVRWRDVYTVEEPVRNVGNAASGVLTADGIHLSQATNGAVGKTLCAARVLAGMAFA